MQFYHLATQKDITIYDLADRLGLSIATISRALNDDPSVSPRTKKRVSDLAAAVGYRMNDGARMLRSGRSNIIGCIVPRLDTHRMSSIVSAMEAAARQQEFCLVVMQSQGSEETEASCANLLFNKRVDALVVIPSGSTTGSMQHFIPFIQKDIPIALVDRKDEKYPFVNIFTDNHRAGYPTPFSPQAMNAPPAVLPRSDRKASPSPGRSLLQDLATTRSPLPQTRRSPPSIIRRLTSAGQPSVS